MGAFKYWALAESKPQLVSWHNPLEKKQMLTSATNTRFYQFVYKQPKDLKHE